MSAVNEDLFASLCMDLEDLSDIFDRSTDTTLNQNKQSTFFKSGDIIKNLSNEALPIKHEIYNDKIHAPYCYLNNDVGSFYPTALPTQNNHGPIPCGIPQDQQWFNQTDYPLYKKPCDSCPLQPYCRTAVELINQQEYQIKNNPCLYYQNGFDSNNVQMKESPEKLAPRPQSRVPSEKGDIPIGFATRITNDGTQTFISQMPTTSAIEKELPKTSVYQHMGHQQQFQDNPVKFINVTKFPSDATSRSSIAKKQKPVRKSAHNLIEKRYRCSINEKIMELRDILVGADMKISKSSILRRAVDHISHLRNANEQLRRENEANRSFIIQHGLMPPMAQLLPSLSTANCSRGSSNRSSFDESSMSPVDNQTLIGNSRSCSASSITIRSAPVTTQNSPTTPVNKSSVTLFGLMLCLIIINPLQFTLKSTDSSGLSHPNQPENNLGRILESSNAQQSVFEKVDRKSIDYFWHTLTIWLINGIIVACVLARICLFKNKQPDLKKVGNLAISPNEDTWTNVFRHKIQAEKYFSERNFHECLKELKMCLKLSGNTPSPKFSGQLESVFLIIKSICCRFFWTNSKNNLYIAQVYSMLDQIDQMQKIDNRSRTNLYYALNAVIFAECVKGKDEENVRTKIFINAAIRVSSSKTVWSNCLCQYFLSQAKSLVEKSTKKLPGNISWIFDKVGYEFLISKGSGSFVSDFEPVLPLEHLTQHFKSELVKHLLEQLIDPKKKYDNLDWEKFFTLLELCCENEIETDNLKNQLPSDPKFTWWKNIIEAIHFSQIGDFLSARKKYDSIRSCPVILTEKPEIQAFIHGFCAQKLCLENRNSKKFSELVWAECFKAVKAMEKMQDISATNDEFKTLITLIACDWTLKSLMEIWQLGKINSKSKLIILYKKCFNAMKKINNDKQHLIEFSTYGAFLRLATVSNPIQTNFLLFEHSGDFQQGENSTTSKISFCDHLNLIIKLNNRFVNCAFYQ